MSESLVYSDFHIDNDGAAERALEQIAENNRECSRMVGICQEKIDYYTQRQQETELERDTKNGRLQDALYIYFQSVTPKKTKTQATYALPSGRLVQKYSKPALVPDKEKLTELLRGTEYVVNEPSFKWGEYKKTLSIVGGNVIDGNGEVIDGVTVTDQPETFNISLREDVR